MLQYNPQHRITAIEALSHPFFDPIRDPNTRLPDGRPLPPVLNFSRQGRKKSKKITASLKLKTYFIFFLELSIRPDLIRRLVPPHYEQELLNQGIDIHNFEPIPLDQMKISPSAI